MKETSMKLKILITTVILQGINSSKMTSNITLDKYWIVKAKALQIDTETIAKGVQEVLITSHQVKK